MPPLQNIEESLFELRWANDHGACGVLKKGDREAGKYPADPYFEPLLRGGREARFADLYSPRVGRAGFFARAGNFSTVNSCARRGRQSTVFWVSFYIKFRARFPKLRIGCIEAGSMWAPFVAYDLRRQQFKQQGRERARVCSACRRSSLRRMFSKTIECISTCPVDEDLPYILKCVGEDNLMVGSDYTHRDPSMELEFRKELQARADKGDIPTVGSTKNPLRDPKTFYAL